MNGDFHMIKQTTIAIATIGLLTISASAGADIKACVGCHGTKMEKKAMGKSKIVNELKKAEIVTALNGYKDGSYGGAMKGVMKGFASKLDEAAIKAISEEFGK
jgi:cytochrome c-type protein NapB